MSIKATLSFTCLVNKQKQEIMYHNFLCWKQNYVQMRWLHSQAQQISGTFTNYSRKMEFVFKHTLVLWLTLLPPPTPSEQKFELQALTSLT